MTDYVKTEEHTPDNVREEFDTSAINVGMNEKEAADSSNVYDLNEEPHVPTPDPRTLNVVERIAEIKEMYDNGELPPDVDDDYVLKADLEKQ